MKPHEKALKSKMTPQDREDHATSKMMKRVKIKSKGVKLSRSILG